MHKVSGNGGDCGKVEKATLQIQLVRNLGLSEKLKNVKFPKF